MNSPLVNFSWAPADSVAVRLFWLDGTIDRAIALRVISDDGRRLLGWGPVGSPVLEPRTVNGVKLADVPLAERFVIERQLFTGCFLRKSTLRLIEEGSRSSVWWFFEPDGKFLYWYVNLEFPIGRTSNTVDRVDGVLDLLVYPDRTWEWLDEDEAEAAVAAGRLTAEHIESMRTEGERMIALAESGAFPFDGTWCDFQPESNWSLPAIPSGIDTGVPALDSLRP